MEITLVFLFLCRCGGVGKVFTLGSSVFRYCCFALFRSTFYGYISAVALREYRGVTIFFAMVEVRTVVFFTVKCDTCGGGSSVGGMTTIHVLLTFNLGEAGNIPTPVRQCCATVIDFDWGGRTHDNICRSHGPWGR